MLSYLRPGAAPGAPPGQRAPHPDKQERVADEFIERYVSWREQCADVESAYERWRSGAGEDGHAFAIYQAELEFEEHAARAYREAAERLALATSAGIGA